MPEALNVLPFSLDAPEECDNCGHCKELMEQIARTDPNCQAAKSVFIGPSDGTEGGKRYLKYFCSRCSRPVLMQTKNAEVRNPEEDKPADPKKSEGLQPQDKGRAGHIDTRAIGGKVREIPEDVL